MTDQRHEHDQSSPNTTWVITHDLDSVGAIDFLIDFEGVLQKAFPLDVVHDNSTQMTVTWSTAFSGKAVLQGKSA